MTNFNHHTNLKHKYKSTELVCNSHNVKFVRFTWTDGINNKYKYKYHSHGCPVCVGLIRAKVQLEFKRCSTHGKHRYPKNGLRNAKTKRGRPKTKAITTVVEARNGI